MMFTAPAAARTNADELSSNDQRRRDCPEEGFYGDG